MTHVNNRIMTRVKPYHVTLADQLLRSANKIENAAIVAKVDKVKSNDGSNGDYLVLIVRNYYPVTIMYTRETQLTLDHLRVQNIIRL